MYDVVIIGLGPGGSTLARLLNKDLKILAIDKKSLNGNSDFAKPCGGLLAPDAQRALSRFNLTLPKSVLVDPQIFTVKTIDTSQGLARHYQRFYINIDRMKFDRWLMSLIPENVDVEYNSVCTKIEERDQTFRVTFRSGDISKTVESRMIIGADGANSIVRKTLFPDKKIRQYISIQQVFPEQNPNPFYSCIFDPEITDSYCWSVSKDGLFTLGGAFPPIGCKKRFQLLKHKLRQYGFIFDQPIETQACKVSRPQWLGSFCTGSGGAFLLGEAAGFISPSSLEGISYAFESAYRLSKILNRSIAKNPSLMYKLSTLSIRIKLLGKYLKSPFMYNPVLRKIVMLSGIKSINVISHHEHTK